MKIFEHLLEVSGVKLTGATPHTHNDMHEIMHAVRVIFSEKQALYGNHLDARAKEDDIALFESYMEINRKYVRLSKFARDKIRGGERPLGEVVDTLLDLMIYSAMGLQLVLSRIEGTTNEVTRSSRTEPGDRDRASPRDRVGNPFQD